MKTVRLRVHPGQNSAGDLEVVVHDNTYEYLMTSGALSIRVSTFLDRDQPRVEPKYAELHVSDECEFVSKVSDQIPGSRLRKSIILPGEMKEGEQLTVVVLRRRKTESSPA